MNDEHSKVLENQISRLFKIYEILAKLNVPIKIDLSLVRGLAYYTGVIFEVTHPSVSFSIAGGGRYDNLVQLYGGPSTPSIGFAIGVERVLSVLQNLKIGENEKRENKVSIKDLTTRQQSSISLNDLLPYIRQII
jgi:histidyl-tRNA synthetase